MKRLTSIILTGSLLMAIFYSCSKDEQAVSPPVPGNEFLTSVQLIATNAADATDTKTVAVKQLPGQTIDLTKATLNLKKNAVYNVQVKFLDETKSPVGDVTTDIYDRRNYHLICFNVSGGATLTIKRTDKDTNSPALEIGLQDSFTAGAASTGSLNVQLRHQPNAKNGSCDPGSSDADVNFPIVIN